MSLQVHRNRATGKVETVDYLNITSETFEVSDPAQQRWAGHTLTEEMAHLFAAAPEMLQALRLCLLRDPSLANNATVTAAIAKAEGAGK